MIHPTEANILYKTSPKSRPRSPIPLWSETFRRICTLPSKDKLLKYPEPFNEQTKEHCLQIDSVEFFERINVLKIDKEIMRRKNNDQGGEDQHAALSVKNSIEEETLEWAKMLKPTPNVVLHKSREFSIRLKFYRPYDESVDKIGFFIEPGK
uniref:Uncharacterized protein n=1 Tax=Romanomermis culicivorax TaxID=13658 RepID=A0A915KJA6_ROMCU